MTGNFEARMGPSAAADVENVADVYVEPNAELSQRIAPSEELLEAIERLSPQVQDVFRRIIDVGFQAAIRK